VILPKRNKSKKECFRIVTRRHENGKDIAKASHVYVNDCYCGWWLAFIGAIAILAIDAPTQFIRTKTLDYLYGSFLSLGVLFFLVVPFFRRHLLVDDAADVFPA
jgi:hypothetical protein